MRWSKRSPAWATTRQVELHLQPFELNPGIPTAGEPIADYAARKYGVGADALAARQALIRQRGAEVGLATGRAHPCLQHLRRAPAAALGRAAKAGRSSSSARCCRPTTSVARTRPWHDVLLRCAPPQAGLDVDAAREVLASDAYADEVRSSGAPWQQRGIDSVPSVIVDERHLIEGGQTVETYERALRHIAGQPGRGLAPYSGLKPIDFSTAPTRS